MSVVTRFAPSPTGDLHIGGVRTAIFNWLYARRNGGQFKLRIEDTDKQRSTSDSINHIFDSMKWIGLDYDGDAVYQSNRSDRHIEVAMELLHSQDAYYDNGAIRIKGIKGGQTIDDLVQGTVTWPQDIDDFVILRSDGSPTYMLAVVVDDYDMGVTHVIRGDDHLNNAFRQMTIYKAMGWKVPTYAHIPLIHGEDGKKLSKRHGAAGIDFYQNLGIVPDGLFSYLTKLGWGHGDVDIISKDQALQWFDIKDVNRNPARLDMKKLYNVNFQTMMALDTKTLFNMVYLPIEKKYGFMLDDVQINQLQALIPELQPRSKTLNEMIDGAIFLFKDDIEWNDKAKNKFNPDVINDVLANIDSVDWTIDGIHGYLLGLAVAREDKFANIVQPVRIALTGSTISPGIGEIMIILGKDEVVKRLRASV
ncbi:MAG: glutamate--tRNA ligase [Gammaproteobacteria bacterium]|nr:glutamate--tRNA ligase [Gammaproteobacteria bacterium]